MDPRREGKISRDNFHAWARREQLSVPPAAIDELIDYFDQDHAGYIEMQVRILRNQHSFIIEFIIIKILILR